MLVSGDGQDVLQKSVSGVDRNSILCSQLVYAVGPQDMQWYN